MHNTASATACSKKGKHSAQRGKGGKNAWLGGLALAIGALSIYMFYRSASGTDGIPTRFIVHGVCLACQKEGDFHYAAGGQAPFECPSCKQKAGYGWLFCESCNRRFVPKLAADESGIMRIPAYPPCPVCHDVCSQAYYPEVMEQKPIGDAPLPNWP